VPGPHDFAVRISAVRLHAPQSLTEDRPATTLRVPTHLRPPHLTARFVTIAIRPSFG
jgi:hypothetical protein